MTSIAVVFNPNSKKNKRHPERFERLQELLGGWGEVVRTEEPEAVVELAHDFLDRGVPYVVADGGDGAFHWLVNALYTAAAERGKGEKIPAILPTNSGTIDFMGRKAGVIGHAEGLLQTFVNLLADGDTPDIVPVHSVRIDGRRGSEPVGQEFSRIAFAVALAGVGARFFERFYQQQQRNQLGVITTVGRIIGSASLNTPGMHLVPLPEAMREYGGHVFEPMPLDVWIDGEAVPIHRYRALNVGSINVNLAGVFRLFGHAKEPGVLHVQAGNFTVFGLTRALPYMFAGGKKLPLREFVERPARHVRAVCTSDLAMNPVLDGEIFTGLLEAVAYPGPQVDVISLVATD